MWFKKLSRRWLGRRVAVAESSTLRQQKAPRRSLRLNVEQLEDRTVPSSFTAATVSDLIADINAANQVGGSNTITLVAGNSFSLTAADNSTDGATGLPVIAANDNLTLVGNGDTIARSAAAGTPAFRLLDVAFGASLTLENLTLQNGVAAQGSGVSAEGGAIYNQGTLDLNGVTVQKNIANRAGGAISSHNGALTLEGATNVQSNAATGYVVRGRGFPVAGLGGGLYLAGGTAMLSNVNLSSNTAQGAPGFGQGANGFGGAVYIAFGAVTLTGDTLSSNTAQGGGGGPGNGGNGLGGALYVAGGTVTLTSDTLSSNTAKGGGAGTNGGSGFGGALYAAGGTVTLRNDIVTGNTAVTGPGTWPRLGEGGGLYIDSAALVYLDAFTQAHVIGNIASTSDPNIHGAWQPC